MNQKKHALQFSLSVLDLAAVMEGSSVADTYRHSLELAQTAERLGYTRFWISEHHNMESVASPATSILIGHIGNATNSIRVGSGGIMLPNHSPLAVAEQFGTLATLYPDRVDLGLGRAPGTDPLTANALGRDLNAVYHFDDKIKELQTYFSADNRNATVRALPGEGLDIPLWVLGSSTDSAYVAAQLGLPYAFATHFAPGQFETAITAYRKNFVPSQQLSSPYVMACVNVIAADTNEEARFLSNTLYQMFLNIIRGISKPAGPPSEKMHWMEQEKSAVLRMTEHTFVGDALKIRSEIDGFVKSYQLDELMVASHIFDHVARLKSYKILADTFAG